MGGEGSNPAVYLLVPAVSANNHCLATHGVPKTGNIACQVVVQSCEKTFVSVKCVLMLFHWADIG